MTELGLDKYDELDLKMLGERGFIDRTLYRDKQGNPLSLGEWARRTESNRYRVVDWTPLRGGMFVSTIWIGIDLGLFASRPLLFETMVFAPDDEHPLAYSGRRWATEAEAIRGHNRIADRVAQAPWVLGVGGRVDSDFIHDVLEEEDGY